MRFAKVTLTFKVDLYLSGLQQGFYFTNGHKKRHMLR